MIFKWIDYGKEYEDEIELWMSNDDSRLSGSNSIKEEHEYYIGISDDYDGHNYKFNETYFCKVVFEKAEIIAVIILLRGDGYPMAINPLIVNPKHRNKGYGTKIICELINNTSEITGFNSNVFDAAIFPHNKASIKAFEKAGFVSAGIHIAGDCTYWVYPAFELDSYRKYLANSMGNDFIASPTL